MFVVSSKAQKAVEVPWGVSQSPWERNTIQIAPMLPGLQCLQEDILVQNYLKGIPAGVGTAQGWVL